MFRSLIVRLRALLRAEVTEREIEEELAYHLERETERNVARGMAPPDAALAARRSIGNAVLLKERARAAARWPLLDDLARDVRYALRALRKSPVFTAVAVLSLALGIGANAAIFSVVDAIILRNLPVPRPDRLFYVKRNEDAIRSFGFSKNRDLQRYAQLQDVFAGVAGVVDIDRSNVDVGGAVDADPVRIALVSANYFTVLGVGTRLGRPFNAEEDDGAHRSAVVVISDAYWKRHFGSSRGALLHNVSLNGIRFTIVGVAPPGFAGDWAGRAVDMWIPLSMYGPITFGPASGDVQVHRVVVRLRQGVTEQRAQSALDVVAPQLAATYLRENPELPPVIARQAKLRVMLSPAAHGFSLQRASLTRTLVILIISVAFLLLILCANVANLLLARSAARQREVAVRIAIGAGTARVVRQLVTENIVLALLGGALGLVVDLWATRALMRFVATGSGGMLGYGSMSFDLHPGLRLFAFMAVLCIVAGLLFGMVPATRLARGPLAPALSRRDPDASANRRGRFRLSKLLVAGQVALSVVLLVSAGLLVRTLSNLRKQQTGYDKSHILLVWTAPGESGRQNAGLASLAELIQQRMAQLPGVRSVAVSSAGLLNGIEGNYGSSEGVRVQGQTARAGLSVTRSVVTPGFFTAAGVNLRGRDFAAWDTDTSLPVAIINETLARFEFGTEDAIGKRIGVLNDNGTPREIVGVVKDAKYNTAREQKMGMLYLPHRQRSRELATMCVVVRAAGDPRELAPRVREELRSIDTSLPILSIGTLDDQLDSTLVTERLTAAIGELFGTLAALFACLGLYGVIAYTVARRAREIGIRMALGARQWVVLLDVVRESLLMVGAGVIVGVPASLAMTRVMASQLFGVGPADPLTFGAAVTAITLTACIATLVPARRAARVDPAVALRSD